MAFRTINFLQWLGVLILATPGMLSAAEPASEPIGTAGSALRIAVATTLAPLSDKLSALLPASGKRARFISLRSERPLDTLARGEADIALVARQIDENEARQFTARVFGYDRLLFVVHERNPLERISMATMRAILSREFSDWQQIGAGNSGAIVPVIRAPGSDTRRFVDEGLGIGEVMPAGMVEVGSNLAAALYIAADPQAIGYLSSGAYEQARQRGLRMKTLMLDGAPSALHSCGPDSVSLCRPLLLVQTREAAASDGRPLNAALSGEAGRALLIRHGFFPARSTP